jgi:hypothetical protein
MDNCPGVGVGGVRVLGCAQVARLVSVVLPHIPRRGGGGKELALMISSSLSTSPHHGVSLSHPTLSYNRYPSHAQN